VRLADVVDRTGFEVLEHLEAEAEVPVLGGLQAQGDLIVVPDPRAFDKSTDRLVPAAGVAVIEATGGGHEHRLFAGTAGTAWWHTSPGAGQDIGVLHCTEPALLLHPEHGAASMAPGSYVLRRQREQAAEERLVAD
jgi:hypothetical protein